jgi:hypothetical protein
MLPRYAALRAGGGHQTSVVHGSQSLDFILVTPVTIIMSVTRGD